MHFAVAFQRLLAPNEKHKYRPEILAFVPSVILSATPANSCNSYNHDITYGGSTCDYTVQLKPQLILFANLYQRYILKFFIRVELI